MQPSRRSGNIDSIWRVLDDGLGAPANGAVGAGNGILGMRERASALGGQVQTGPRPGGGFRVRAWLPVDVDLDAAEPVIRRGVRRVRVDGGRGIADGGPARQSDVRRRRQGARRRHRLSQQHPAVPGQGGRHPDHRHPGDPAVHHEEGSRERVGEEVEGPVQGRVAARHDRHDQHLDRERSNDHGHRAELDVDRRHARHRCGIKQPRNQSPRYAAPLIRR